MILSLYRLETPQLELGFHIEASGEISIGQINDLLWLTADPTRADEETLTPRFKQSECVEIGPRKTIESPFSSNAVAICHRIGISSITRIEQTQRHLITGENTAEQILAKHLDRMTQERYEKEFAGFGINRVPTQVAIVDLLCLGKPELVRLNKELGWGMDESDINFYSELFMEKLGRNPTLAELYQLANANSEHSRHGYWHAQQIHDGVAEARTLMQIVKEPHTRLPQSNRSLLAFKDGAGVMKGYYVSRHKPRAPGFPSPFVRELVGVHMTATAETHNHPTLVSPFPGAQTGAGGREGDNASVGKGAMTGVSAAGYFVGNLFIPGYAIPGEVFGKDKPSKYASPLHILLEGCRGVAMYQNPYGEPCTFGFTRTFGLRIDGEWQEPRKPILYSAGIGHIFDEHVHKGNVEPGMLVIRLGGSAYPIGMNGGGASSMTCGENTEKLDFNSVQRGNPKERNVVNRVIRTCVEMRHGNPIVFIQDTGAGGIANGLTEAIAPHGGKIRLAKVKLGDMTMDDIQIWVCEYQEGYILIIKPTSLDTFSCICKREGAHFEVLGEITGDGKVTVYSAREEDKKIVDLNIDDILTKLPQKVFKSSRRQVALPKLNLPKMTIAEAVARVLILPAVGSKGWIVHAKDRSVTGLVVGQQCCGIEQIPIADVSVNALDYQNRTGTAASIGENPNRMLIDPKAGARMAIGEQITNLAGVVITGFSDIRYRANWMWPAKLAFEGPRIYDAAVAMSDLLIELGLAVDGGKDSLSMSAKIGEEVAKSPGSLVMLGYAPVLDFTRRVTPDIKEPGSSQLFLIDIGRGKNRLGGSALAQACDQLGDESPDVDDPDLLKRSFEAIQEMITHKIITALHDRSDGGLFTTIAEMCMASRCGFSIFVNSEKTALAELFSEELGWVLEVPLGKENVLRAICHQLRIPLAPIGITRNDPLCDVQLGDSTSLYTSTIAKLRAQWESTSYELERLQSNPVTAKEAYFFCSRSRPHLLEDTSYRLTFKPQPTDLHFVRSQSPVNVAIIREEGSNSEREMAAACMEAGFVAHDVTMSDLLDGRAILDKFQGIIFVGGFSYMDVFGSGKGWAASIRCSKLQEMFEVFYNRPDTFGLGVCNGFQVFAHLGWNPFKGTLAPQEWPYLVHNTSRKFESRWVQVKVTKSPSIFFQEMEGSVLGIWVAHGEGRMYAKSPGTLRAISDSGLAPLVYVDHLGNPTEEYPCNPNGSPLGLTSWCSKDGRFNGLMPHMERASFTWQWPYMPPSWNTLPTSPWLFAFQSAHKRALELRERAGG